MARSTARRRGTETPEAARTRKVRKRWLVALVGVSLVGGAIALAFAVRTESCDIETLNPRDREIICAMRDRDPSTCPTSVLTLEQCQRYLDEFNHPAG